jgi:hypothetical protein
VPGFAVVKTSARTVAVTVCAEAAIGGRNRLQTLAKVCANRCPDDFRMVFL